MPRPAYATVAVAAALGAIVAAQPPARPAASARVFEDVRTITTYPYSEPNPVPILAKDSRLYPYHSFEGYAQTGVPRQWKVVHLENDLVEVLVLPQVGGKIWGARVKKTGHEFIYQNDVLKFRNVALRGPWTSGGIEFNFGVVGHTPSTATPVDYALRTNPDGSVSCIVGTMDLPSRTEWRVEIRLPADKAAFETNVLWHNPTSVEQPYYNWMTAAASARDDLVMYIPGTAYLDHPGRQHAWPEDEERHYLPRYRDNTFGDNKSFHVVGELQHFFGGYYERAGYGFGHASRHEDMPGQKLWLWALSRSGGIWETLLTDTRGQYVEYQAGRLFVQYTPAGERTPITQAGFEPSATDRWSETWFPVEGLGGITDASPEGAMYVRHFTGRMDIAVHAFRAGTDTLRVWSDGRLVLEKPVTFEPLVPIHVSAPGDIAKSYRIELRGLALDYQSPEPRLARALDQNPNDDEWPVRSEADRFVFEARELARARRFGEARPKYLAALKADGWNRAALLGIAEIAYRQANYDGGLWYVRKALRLDTYDPEANFKAGLLYRALGKTTDAREAFGWAARSVQFRSAANVQLAEMAMERGEMGEAARYARIALDFNRQNLSAWDVLATVGRVTGDRATTSDAITQGLQLDPLHHFAKAEAFLASRANGDLDALLGELRGEYPDQAVLELAITYAGRGRSADAIALLDGATTRLHNPLLPAWRAYLAHDAGALPPKADVAFVFPYRHETLRALRWAAGESKDWTWTYLLALNLWALDRTQEAMALMAPLGNTPDFAPFYVSRATLVERAGGDPEADLVRAEALAGSDRNIRIPLIRYYQQQRRWADALNVSARGRKAFPGDFNLDLLHARALVNLGRANEAIGILDGTHVLPSENARESHQLYVDAHVLAAFAAIDGGRLDEAQRHLEAALEWPEHLGQGKPYEPEERLVRFVMGRVAERRGRTEDARRAFEAVVSATPTVTGEPKGLDLLAAPALRALGRDVPISTAGPRPAADLEGELLNRALSLPAR